MSLIVLTEKEIAELNYYSGSDRVSDEAKDHVAIISLARDYNSVRKMAKECKCDRRRISKWLNLYKKSGITGLVDAPGPGGRNRISAEKRQAIIKSTKTEKPIDGLRWTVRSMARRHGVSPSTVNRIWSEELLQPKRRKRRKQ